MTRIVLLTALLALIAVSVPAAPLTVRELSNLIASDLAGGKADGNIARDVSRVEMRERLTESALDALRGQGIGPKTAGVLELLKDDSEFLESGDASRDPPLRPRAQTWIRSWRGCATTLPGMSALCLTSYAREWSGASTIVRPSK